MYEESIEDRLFNSAVEKNMRQTKEIEQLNLRIKNLEKENEMLREIIEDAAKERDFYR